MTLIDRYLAREVLRYTALVMAVLLMLAALFLFLDQQSDVGVGTYSMLDAALVTVLLLPKQAFLLLPIAALMGALLGLGNLARGSELIVVRATGLSAWRIAFAAGMAGAFLLVLATFFGEYLATPLETYANHVKTIGKYSYVGVAANGIVWLKEGNQMISIDRQAGDHSYGGVRIYQLATDDVGRQQLWSLSQADRADISASQVWTLRNYVTSVLGSLPVVTQQAASLRLETPINSDFLSLAAVDPDSLPLRALLGYIRHLRANDLAARPWEVALWSRLARSLSTVVLCMLAVPFVLGPLRSSGAGLRIVLGIAIGVIYFLVNRTLENSGAIYGMPPLVIAWAPLAVLSVVTAVALARAR